jgi:peptidoglycan/xylan/chitin deacetylase (PgdA/CDA1 family)
MQLFRLLVLVLLALAALPATAREARIALTFDDLPELSLVEDAGWDRDLNERLLAGLERHHLPATGFVVGDKLEADRAGQTAILDLWLAAGYPLENHTYSHESPSELGTAGYIADIARDDALLRPLLGKYHRKPRWFRHPYLETGATVAARHEIDGWLARHGYRVAPVSLVPSDYEFSEPYDAALAHRDEAHARAIRRAWLSYFRRSVVWYREASHVLFGRDIAYVLLLHANRLNADTIDELAAILEREQLKVVSLDKAIRDPAYRIADAYAGKDGIDWMERWSRVLKKPLPWDTFREPSAAIQAEYARVDKDAETAPLTLDQVAPPEQE